MDDAWQVLREAGVPVGAARPAALGPFRDADVLAALARVLADVDHLPTRQADPLLAWLGAFAHHWPTRFERTLGDKGRDAIARLHARHPDANRYLKLRRIATAHLTGLI